MLILEHTNITVTVDLLEGFQDLIEGALTLSLLDLIILRSFKFVYYIGW